jgi:hypothetical protein
MIDDRREENKTAVAVAVAVAKKSSVSNSSNKGEIKRDNTEHLPESQIAQLPHKTCSLFCT